jgi:catechol 2,3-dioxygenase-like lactoylglutathione lyase family enzyme
MGALPMREFSATRPPAASACAFSLDATPDQVVQHLRALGVAVLTGPGERQGAQGTLMSVYCRDPDGALIESAS